MRELAPEFGFEFDAVMAIEPLGFLEFLQQEANARLALTDSGGGPGGDVHSCSSGVTLRENTKRPEIRWIWERIFLQEPSLSE